VRTTWRPGGQWPLAHTSDWSAPREVLLQLVEDLPEG
jgi:hypothetical protein